MRWFALLVLALALVAAGCGGGDDESAASDETTIEETTTSEDTTSEDTTSEDTPSEDTGDEDTDLSGTPFLTEDCLAVVAAFTALAAGVGAAGGGNDESIDEAAAQFQEYVDRAPDEIKDDLGALAAAYAEYTTALQDLGLGAGDQPSTEQLAQLTAASGKLNTPEVLAASESFSNWASTNCPR
jgi:hypothetical protein